MPVVHQLKVGCQPITLIIGHFSPSSLSPPPPIQSMLSSFCSFLSGFPPTKPFVDWLQTFLAWRGEILFPRVGHLLWAPNRGTWNFAKLISSILTNVWTEAHSSVFWLPLRRRGPDIPILRGRIPQWSRGPLYWQERNRSCESDKPNKWVLVQSRSTYRLRDRSREFILRQTP